MATENKNMQENLKIGLLGVIAITLIVNTFFIDNSTSRQRIPDDATTPQSNVAITPSSPINLNPTTASANNVIAPVSQSEGRAKTTLAFAEMNHNFGEIKQDSKNTHVFKFTNTGTEPLIIEDAKGSCGCTVPKFPKEPIAPGESGDIEVEYSPGKQQGAQAKTVTITSNTDPIITTLNISANVNVQ